MKLALSVISSLSGINKTCSVDLNMLLLWQYVTVKTVLSGHSKRTPKLFFKTDYRLMQGILQYFRPSLSYHLFCLFIRLTVPITSFTSFHNTPSPPPPPKKKIIIKKNHVVPYQTLWFRVRIRNVSVRRFFYAPKTYVFRQLFKQFIRNILRIHCVLNFKRISEYSTNPNSHFRGFTSFLYLLILFYLTFMKYILLFVL